MGGTSSRRQGGRTDIAIEDAPKSHHALMNKVPLAERAGYPLVKTKVDPSQWRTLEGKDGRRHPLESWSHDL